MNSGPRASGRGGSALGRDMGCAQLLEGAEGGCGNRREEVKGGSELQTLKRLALC